MDGGAYDGRIHVPVRGALQQVDRSSIVRPTSSSMRGGDGRTQRANMAQRGIGPDALRRGHGKRRPSACTRKRPATTAGPARRLPHNVRRRGIRRVCAQRPRRAAHDRSAWSPAVVQLLQDLARGGEFAAAFQQRISMRMRFSVDGRAPGGAPAQHLFSRSSCSSACRPESRSLSHTWCRHLPCRR